MKIGFVGLGVMGGPMAMHLFDAGHDLVVWNRSIERRAHFHERRVAVAENLSDLKSCNLIFICVTRSEDVSEVVSQLLDAGLTQPTVFVDHSTIDVETTKSLHAKVENAGHFFIDAPITGGSVGAQKGSLTIFCGGKLEVFDKIKFYLRAYAKTAQLVGPAGSGQLTKVANQIAVGGALIALCESLAFAQKAGLDLSVTRELLSGGAAGSWAFEHYGPRILNHDWTPGFSVDNQLKDFEYCQQAASEYGANIPCTSLVYELLKKLQDAGRGGDTTAALFDVLAEKV